MLRSEGGHCGFHGGSRWTTSSSVLMQLVLRYTRLFALSCYRAWEIKACNKRLYRLLCGSLFGHRCAKLSMA